MSGVSFGRCGVRVREVLELLCSLIPACRLLDLVWNQCNDLYTTSVVNRSYTMIIILFYISVSVVQRSTDSTCEMKRRRKRLGRRVEIFADANARIMQDVLLQTPKEYWSRSDNQRYRGQGFSDDQVGLRFEL